MNLFIYSDESGVFDNNHNDYFVFGGIICFGKEEKNCFLYELPSRKVICTGLEYFEDIKIKIK